MSATGKFAQAVNGYMIIDASDIAITGLKLLGLDPTDGDDICCGTCK